MGYILPEIYQSLTNDFDKKLPVVFIETGTYMGGVPHRMLETYGTLKPFDKIYTIELGLDICKVASHRYKSYLKNDGDLSKFDFHTNEKDDYFNDEEKYKFDDVDLTLICGDSTSTLEKLLKKIDEPICFWLDAHAGAMKYARGDDDVPLLKELDVISNHHINNHIIGIDDAHLFGTKQISSDGGVCDYTEVTYEKVRDKLLQINPNYDIGIYKPYDMEMVLAI
tara:strand:- start:1409 stop:2080 length:672 start_codon:yes stop_codon:yes gene_type:complete